MATRYLYNNEKYTFLYALRQAIGKVERLAYGNPATQEEFDKLPLQHKVTVEEYNPQDEVELEVLRTQCMRQMTSTFNQYRVSPTTKITSSLGFDVNANTDAFENVQGCIAQIEQGIIQPMGEGQEAIITFMDFNNTPHELTVDQLKVLSAEIAQNGSRAYAKKWVYREQINGADRETLKGLTTFDFAAE